MISRESRNRLFRQSTCPAVINSKEEIPFCIPSYKNIHENASIEDGNMIDDETSSEYRRQASSLGSLNRDLYIVDQYESQESTDDPNGCFSSSIPGNFPPEHVGRAWFALTYEEKSEKLILSLFKARNLKRCQGAGNQTSSLHASSTTSVNSEEVNRRSPTVGLKRKLFAMGRRHTSTCRREPIDKLRNVKRGCDNAPQAINSLVQLYLLPDERVLGQAKSKKKDSDPVFVDRFVFQVSVSELRMRSIRMLFVEVDDNHKHHVLGHVTRSLSSCRMDGRVIYADLEKGSPPVCTDSIDCIDAEIQVSLLYNDDSMRLTVVLLRMKLCFPSEKNIEIEQDINLRFNVFGKPTRSKRCKTVQRQVAGAKQTTGTETNAEFAMRETFRFDLKPEEFDKACLIVNVKSRSRKSENNSCVALGGFMFARGSALEHWSAMTTSPKKFVQSWHHLTTSKDTDT